MSAYHLFIEGIATGPNVNVAHVAVAIGARFGIDAAEISKRLAAGRFRVKSNVDFQTANAFKLELERLGVRCALFDATTGAPASVPTHAAPAQTSLGLAPAPRPAMPPHMVPLATPAPTPAPATVPAPDVAVPRTISSSYQSGLAAAFAPQATNEEAALGALATGAFKLTALDSKDDEEDMTGQTLVDPQDHHPAANAHVAATTFDPPPLPAPARAKPATAPASASSSAAPSPAAAPELTFIPVDPKPGANKPSAAPMIDMFGPPPDEGDEQSLSLLVDVRKERLAASQELASQAQDVSEHPGAGGASAAVATGRVPTRDLAPREVAALRNKGASTPPASAATSPSPAARLATTALALLRPMPRWICGLVVALGLGFMIANAYASGQEATKLPAVDKRVLARQAEVVTPTEWEELDGYRATELAAKRAEKQRIAIAAGVAWLITSALCGALWNLAIPWQRIQSAAESRYGGPA